MESIPEDHLYPENKRLLLEDIAYFLDASGFMPELPKGKGPEDILLEDLFFLGCRNIARLLRQDRDWINVNDGYEGTGKSNSSMWLCVLVDEYFYKRNLDPDTHLKDILFEAAHVQQSIKHSKPYEAKNIDEGSKSLFAREAMKEKNIDLIKTFTLCRQKNQFLNINSPTIWILDPYIRLFRVKTWGHNFEEYEERGFIKLFRKKTAMWKGDPFFELRAEAVLPKFDFALWDDYLVKKDQYSVEDKKSAIYERNKAILRLVEKDVMNQGEIGDIFAMTQQNVSNIVAKWDHGN